MNEIEIEIDIEFMLREIIQYCITQYTRTPHMTLITIKYLGKFFPAISPELFLTNQNSLSKWK